MEKKYAILGDIHSNYEALTAVVADARGQGVTDFICVGDVVGYNASPVECVALIRGELDCLTVRGNHDHYCAHEEELDDFQPLAASVLAWTKRQLSDADVAWLGGLPLSRVFSGVTIVHSTLDMPQHWGYVFDSFSAEAHFICQTTPLCFHGHTHVPIIFEKKREVIRMEPEDMKMVLGAKYFINVGSVGQPRDNDPRSSYVLYLPQSREVLFRRVAYDIETAMQKNLHAGLPERLALRLCQGK